ncbi:MAG: Tim44-like domain-containing protein [Gammaproteobacteria bacterium]
MRTFFVLFMSVMLAFGLIANDAAAKRFGGGRSFGMSRSMNSFSRPQAFAAPRANMAANKSKWLAPLAGLAIGSILGSLLMGHGLGSGILAWLAIAFIGMTLFRLFRGSLERKMASANNNYHMQRPQTFEQQQPLTSPLFSANLAEPAQADDFDMDTFVRDARVAFYRLQAAYDQKDLNDLRQFTSPEVYAEIQMQLEERGDAENQTLVLNLDAKVLEAQNLVASVQFSGKIKENQDAANFFEEVWHFTRNDVHGRWVVAGLQQELVH